MKVMKRSVSCLLALIMMLGTLTAIPATAAEAEEPAPVKDTYVINGVTYYNTNSKSFNKSPKLYYTDLLDTKSSELSSSTYGDRSMSQLWMQLGLGLVAESAAYHPMLGGMENAVLGSGDTFISSGSDSTGWQTHYAVSTAANAPTAQHYNSRAEAEKAVFSVLESSVRNYGTTATPEVLQQNYGRFTSELDNAQNDVIMSMAYAEPVGTRNKGDRVAAEAVVVYFDDLQVVPIIPDDTGNTYLKTSVKTYDTSDADVADCATNDAGFTSTHEQHWKEETTSTMGSTFSGSTSYSYATSIKESVGFEFKVVKENTEVDFTYEKAISEGWTKSESVSHNESVEHVVKVDLPPNTRALLKQTKGVTEIDSRYNCPVALTYTAHIVLYDLGITNGTSKYSATNYDWTFGKTTASAIEDLNRRAVIEKDIEGNDPDGVNWTRFEMYGNAVLGCNDARDTIVCHAPMSPVSATFTEVLSTTNCEVTGVVPLYPLSVIKVAAPKDQFISGDAVSYDKYNYLTSNMQVGDSSYTNYLDLTGLDTQNVEYYGFSKANGHWIVADAAGNPWDDANGEAPVVIEKTPAGEKYTAVKAGTCFLKYVINENCYNHSQAVDSFTTNAELKSTAAVEVNVSEAPVVPQGTIAVKGSYKGYVGAAPDSLDKDGALSVYIYDKNEKEIEADYTWELQESAKRGAELNEDGQIVFTQPGTFHVRAVCDSLNLTSDWVEITAVTPQTYTLGDADGDGNVTSLDATRIQRVIAKIEVSNPDLVRRNGDVDGDGNLTSLDVTYLQRYLAKIHTSYPIGEKVIITE